MKYLVSSMEKCIEILSNMDDYYNYPNSDTKTDTTSDIVASTTINKFMIFVPQECYEMLTQENKNLCVDEIPEEFL
jgi:hypothetical protein|tara:strand:+ start:393 stop:620 length:228 start_codon:yes stop_codon:yes gene_type:complete